MSLKVQLHDKRCNVNLILREIFRDIILATMLEAGSTRETVRDRMACIPDLRLGLQVPLVPRPAAYYTRRGRPAAAPQEDPTPAPPALSPGHRAGS